MPIESIGTAAVGLTSGGAPASAKPASGFTESLGRLVNAAAQSDHAADAAVSNMLNKTGDVHEAMIALQQADLMLQLSVQVRNKLVQAYQDIMRMPV